MPEVSLVIVNWNTKEDLRRCLISIFETTPRDLSLQVIVVDNNSQDRSAEMVAEMFPQVELIKLSSNVGLATGWNIAIKEARGNYIVLLNPDIQLQENCLRVLCEYLNTHPKVGGVGPRLIDEKGQVSTYGAYVRLPTLLQFMLFWTPLRFFSQKVLFLRRRLMGEIDPEVSQPVDQPPGAFLVLRKTLWNQIGGADASFFLYYEDVDLARRICDDGWPLWYVAEAEAIHKGGGTLNLLNDNARRLIFYTSACRYFDKHHGRFSAFLVMLLSQLNFVWIALRNLFKPATLPVYFNMAGHLWQNWRYQFVTDRETCYRVANYQEKVVV